MISQLRLSTKAPDVPPTSDKAGFAESDASADLPESFETFVGAYYKAAYRFALSLCRNHDDACDLTQQAFYIAQTRDDQLRDPAKRKQWLFTILHREFLRLRRREGAHPRCTLEASERELPPVETNHAAGLDSGTVLMILGNLEEHLRTPVVLFYLNELSYKEIAGALSVPIGTVMSRLSRGKEMIRQRLDDMQVQVRSTVGVAGMSGGQRLVCA